MKIIDLLNKIANGEEVPRKIKYRDNIYVYTDDGYRYDDDLQVLWLTNDIEIDNVDRKGEMVLNKEIEIIEEDKKIEEIRLTNGGLTLHEDRDESDIVMTTIEMKLAHKINEIIEVINEKNQNSKR